MSPHLKLGEASTALRVGHMEEKGWGVKNKGGSSLGEVDVNDARGNVLDLEPEGTAPSLGLAASVGPRLLWHAGFYF